jgi:methanogenic corrinoid protein MtbC1
VPKTQKLLVSAVARLQEDKVICLVRQGLTKGVDPFVLLEEVRLGLEKVGEQYNRGEYFLADLIIAAEIFREVQDIVLGRGDNCEAGSAPQIVFGTVEEDIHDIGKNIAISVMRSRGLRVLDLGVNVPPQEFAARLKETGAHILCLSGLITEAYESMKKTVHRLEEESLRQRTTVLIGGLVNEVICNYAGADYWFRDCTGGLEICRKILAGTSPQQLTNS